MTARRTALIAGGGGQLGYELQRCVPAGWEAVAPPREALDITDPATIAACVAEYGPQLIINAAAYTAVDRAEEPEQAAIAHAVNADGAGNLALAARDCGARLIHVSTDFVFDGEQSRPYRPDDVPAPLGVYGTSKLAGEQQVKNAHADAVIIRTGWVYSAHGHNFVKTMLRLMGEREELGVVADQVGTPTWAHTLAVACWAAAGQPGLSGLYHWSDAGVASWYDLAVAVMEEGVRLGLLERSITVRPITSADYPTPARRPAYSVLDKHGSWRDLELDPQHWRAALRRMMEELMQ